MKIESNVYTVNSPQQCVYDKIADLNNLLALKERFDEPEVQEKMKANIPADKIEQVRKALETMKADTDSVSISSTCECTSSIPSSMTNRPSSASL